MDRPRIAYVPLPLAQPHASATYPTHERILADAYLNGMRFVNVPCRLLPSSFPESVRCLAARLKRHQLEIAHLYCVTDFAHPDPEVRSASRRMALDAVTTARVLGAEGLQVTCGAQRSQVPVEDQIGWCSGLVKQVAAAGRRAGVRVSIKYYSGYPMSAGIDLAAHGDTLLQILHRLREPQVTVSFDTSTHLLAAEDPLDLLSQIRDQVVDVCASDRYPGQQSPMPVGSGNVDLDGIFQFLAESGFTGFIGAMVDTPSGAVGTGAAAHLLRRKIAEWWG